jgi:hypothetical protein
MTVQPEEPSAQPSLFVGAAINSEGLLLLALQCVDGAFSVARSQSALFAPPADDQLSLKRTQNELARFLNESRIERLVLRTGQPRGRFVAGADVFRLQSALDLLPAVSVIRVDGQSLRAWADANASKIPASDPTLPIRMSELEATAIAAAAVAYELHCGAVQLVNGCIRAGEPSYCPSESVA